MLVDDRQRVGRPLHAVMDVVAILAISFAAEATHFSYQQGRAVISGDSAQYVASAEALLSTDHTPHFEMRKPGYILFLAAIKHAAGNMGCAVIVVSHFLLAFLPLVAYGLGRNLQGRLLGWLGAILTVAALQDVVYGNRMMSESLYTFLLSLGLLSFVVGLRRQGRLGWLFCAGILFGLAWLTRGTATPVIVVSLVFLCGTRWLQRARVNHDTGTARVGKQPRILFSCACFLAPVVVCILVECGLNLAYAGRFRPSNGTVGATILLRARHFQGDPWPETAEAEQVISLLPQRSPEDAYIAHLLDVWVARYHAVHDEGMDEWEYDDLMGRVGLAALRHNLSSYLKSSVQIAWFHLSRQPDGQRLSPVSLKRRLAPLMPPVAVDDRAAETGHTPPAAWFAYWGLPHVTRTKSVALVERMQTAASQRTPLSGAALWRALRWWKTKPAAVWTLAALAWLGSLWPGFALLGCALLGLNRITCLYLASLYVIDALFIGFLTPTTARLQFVWLASDKVLAAAVPIGLLGAVRVWYACRRAHALEADGKRL